MTKIHLGTTTLRKITVMMASLHLRSYDAEFSRVGVVGGNWPLAQLL